MLIIFVRLLQMGASQASRDNDGPSQTPPILQCSLGESPSIREKGKNVGQGCVATKAWVLLVLEERLNMYQAESSGSIIDHCQKTTMKLPPFPTGQEHVSGSQPTALFGAPWWVLFRTKVSLSLFFFLDFSRPFSYDLAKQFCFQGRESIWYLAFPTSKEAGSSQSSCHVPYSYFPMP